MPPLTLDGTNGVSAVQAGAVEGGDLAAGAIGSGDLPAGSVIQVVHTQVRPNIVTTSGPIAIGLSTSITPNSGSSTFLLIATIHAESDVSDSGYGLVFFRNGSEIRTPGDYYAVYSPIANIRTKSTFQFLDTPNTTSTIIYDARPEVYNNQTVKFGEGFFDCNLTIMEIAG